MQLNINSTIKAKSILWTRDFILIFVSTITLFFAFHSLLTTLSVYIIEQGGSKGIAGLGVAAVTVSAVIIRPITGAALDRYGRKIVLIIGLLTFLIPCIFYNFMLSIIPLLVFRFLQGFGWGISNTSQGTVASDVIPLSRMGEGMGYFTMANGISYAVSPAIAFWLLNNYSFQALFLTCVVITIISLLLALMVRYPKHEASQLKGKQPFFDKQTLRPSAVMLLVTITFGSVLSFLALFAQQQGLLNAGLFFTVMAIAIITSRPVAGLIVDQKGRAGSDMLVIIGISIVVAAMIVVAQMSSSWHLVFGGMFFGIGFGVMQPTMITLCIKSVPSTRKGAANATFMTGFDIGVTLGSIMGGIVANYFGYAIMFYLAAIPPALALLVYFIKRGDSFAVSQQIVPSEVE